MPTTACSNSGRTLQACKKNVLKTAACSIAGRNLVACKQTPKASTPRVKTPSPKRYRYGDGVIGGGIALPPYDVDSAKKGLTQDEQIMWTQRMNSWTSGNFLNGFHLSISKSEYRNLQERKGQEIKEQIIQERRVDSLSPKAFKGLLSKQPEPRNLTSQLTGIPSRFHGEVMGVIQNFQNLLETNQEARDILGPLMGKDLPPKREKLPAGVREIFDVLGVKDLAGVRQKRLEAGMAIPSRKDIKKKKK